MMYRVIHEQKKDSLAVVAVRPAIMETRRGDYNGRERSQRADAILRFLGGDESRFSQLEDYSE